MTKVQKKLPSHNIGFAKAGAKFPGVEDFRTLSRKKTFSFFIFCKFEKRKWFLLEFVFIESFKFLSPAFAKPLTVSGHCKTRTDSVSNTQKTNFMAKGRILQVKAFEITVISQLNTDYISLTNMAVTFREGSKKTGKWITNNNNIEYLGVWGKINNPDFNYPEFGVTGQEAGTSRFIMSAGQWIDRTKAVGMLVKAGRYGTRKVAITQMKSLLASNTMKKLR
ncbi:hypothetical protein SDC9_80844 [bioreactor metagenome]|jgi:hypothetical protein|uniref:KilA/APSES-type HTH DNA-binding domain-containing protein n=3 Tax=root TaxID=1 RepID=A0A644Z0K1_9ZZZZ|nr:KilA-N domain-containing protein [Synergistaceae bacterium]MDD5517674.1 KilA-N domain-containing protein [Bacteroidales bacterium]